MSDQVPDIITGISKPDLFEKFKQQLQKDFESCGVNGEFSASLTANYDSIHERLVKELSQISKTASSKINELLYRIDISEQQLKKLSTLKPEEDLVSIMAELIIKRILQKIVYKEFYKS
ncbi:MAG: hypothetical protein JNK50_11955 [Bacteroidia bacterium]|nr:hypothetical protein [Bacteroidia bacterium]